MQREFLANLGLDKDTIDQIMAENGKDINAEKAKATAAEASLAELQATLDEANETIKGFKAKDLDVDAAKRSAEEWEAKYKEAERARKAAARDHALSQALGKTNTVDPELLKACLDMDKIIFDDDGEKIIGLDDQIAGIKESKPYLFAEPQKPKLKGAHIGESGDVLLGEGMTLQEFRKMSPADRYDFSVKHPEDYRKLYGGNQ